MKTKAEILLDAFTEMRINGITVDPDNEDLQLALIRLEDFMSELSLDIGYNFEQSPDINSDSGLPNYANFAIASAMALRLSAPYGKLPQTFAQQASASMSRLLARVATPPRVAYPSRQPVGRGNEPRSGGTQFFGQSVAAPISFETKVMSIHDRITITVDFAPWFAPGETISSYTATPNGLTINSQSSSGSIVTMSVTATAAGWQLIAFAVTGTASTIVNRDLNFSITDPSSVGATHA